VSGGAAICYLTPGVDGGRPVLVVGGPGTIREMQVLPLDGWVVLSVVQHQIHGSGFGPLAARI